MKFSLLLLLFLMSGSALSKKIQIIHTNDLHSYLLGHSPLKGGYYRVKTLIDKLRADALDQGIESIILDAGDFGEGAHYFLLDDGMHSFKALDMLGIDATVIGNHDYMFGGKFLGEQIRTVNSKTKFFGANIVHTPEMRLGDLLHPTASFNVGGVKLEIVGLTTNSLHFMYAIRPGLILPADEVSRTYTQMARDKGVDLVVALTHIGVLEDKKLVKKDPNIDVIIGGHSHTRLEKAIIVKNSEGRTVPIVQTGAQAMAVGSLILDVKGPKNVEVISYQLHDANASVEPDPEVLDYVLAVDKRTKEVLGEGRWDEVIGTSQFDLTGYVENGHQDHQSGCWLKHLPRILKEGTDADVGVYLGAFTGKRIYAGEITYGDIIENFPHVNEYGQKGWEIVTFDVKGWQLYSFLTALVNTSVSDTVLLGGVDYRTYQFSKKIPYLGGRKFFTRLRVNGRRIHFRKKYKVALPFELSRMLEALFSKRVRKYIKFERGNHYLWPMAESYIRKRQVLKCR